MNSRTRPVPLAPSDGLPRPPFADRGVVHLVDDDAALRRALERLLIACGFQVRTFSSAEEFLAAWAANARGCLLLDMHMPGCTGLELQQELQRRGSKLPIVFLTGHADTRTRQIALEQGAVDFLEKPVREPDLVAALDRALTQS